MSHNEPVSVRVRCKIAQLVVFDGESIPSVAARIERSVTVVYRYVNIHYDTGDVLSHHEIDKRDGYKKDYAHKIDDDAFAVEYRYMLLTADIRNSYVIIEYTRSPDKVCMYMTTK